MRRSTKQPATPPLSRRMTASPTRPSRPLTATRAQWAAPAPRLARVLLVGVLLVGALLAGAFSAAPAAAQQPTPAQAADRPAAQPNAEKVVALFDGRTLKGWRVANKSDFEDHGKVEVKDGALRLGKGAPGTGVVWKGEFPRINYELTLEARRVAGDDFFCGLTFPYRKEYCSLIVGGWGGGVIGLSNIDDISAVENETTEFINFKQNRWYAIRLRVTEQKIEVWIDKEKLVDLKTEGHKFGIWWEQEPMRPLGIASWNTGAELRKLSYRPLGKQPPAAKPVK